MDFLEALIDRHQNDEPQIVPRIHSVHESVVAQDRWDVALSDIDHETEQTDFTNHGLPIEAVAPANTDVTEPQPSPPPAKQSTAPSNAQPLQENKGTDLISSVAAKEPEIRLDLSEPGSTRAGEAGVVAAGYAEPAEIQTSPDNGEARDEREAERREPLAPRSDTRLQQSPRDVPALVGGGDETGKPDLARPLVSLFETEQRNGLSQTEPSASEPIAPLTMDICHVQEDRPIDKGLPHPEAQADERIFGREDIRDSAFTQLLQERAERRESETAPARRLESNSESNQGFLQPSAASIAPAALSAAVSQPSALQPEPVINVTIGRVEVRASLPPQKPASKPERRSPTMSLDDYLRRRSGERGR